MHNLKTDAQINSFTLTLFRTQCREIFLKGYFLSPKPCALFFLFLRQVKELTLWEVCWAAVHQTIDSFTHFVGRVMQSVQTKEGQEKLRESTASLYQQRDERCLWRTHHIIISDADSFALKCGRKVCIRARLQISNPPTHTQTHTLPNNWFWSPPQDCLVVAAREIKQER